MGEGVCWWASRADPSSAKARSRKLLHEREIELGRYGVRWKQKKGSLSVRSQLCSEWRPSIARSAIPGSVSYPGPAASVRRRHDWSWPHSPPANSHWRHGWCPALETTRCSGRSGRLWRCWREEHWRTERLPGVDGAAESPQQTSQVVCPECTRGGGPAFMFKKYIVDNRELFLAGGGRGGEKEGSHSWRVRTWCACSHVSTRGQFETAARRRGGGVGGGGGRRQRP